MPGLNRFADIHCHPTLIPFNRNKHIWFHKPPTPCQRREGNFLWDNIGRPYTQSDFVSQARGKVKVVFASLYPIEWRYLTITRKPILDQGFFKAVAQIITCALRAIIQFLGMYTFLGRILSTYPAKRIREILAYDRESFSDLKEEYNLLASEPTIPSHLAAKYNIPTDTAKEIVKNYSGIQSILTDPAKKNTIAVILSAEGAQVLGSGQKNTLDGLPDAELDNLSNPKTAALRNKLVANIHTMKAWPHVPFFIGLCHHFWNQLAGHAMSLPDGGNMLFDQKRGMNTGITELGKVVVAELLSASNGRRILIDAKHMSVKTRQWFYNMIGQHNGGKPEEKKIPVIVSHTGVNSIGTMQASQNSDDHKKEDERYDLSDSIFNIWDINVSDEEIIQVYESNGIIGLILDQRVGGGRMVNDYLNNLPCKVKKDEKLFRQLWVKPYLNNVLHIARVVDAYTQGSLPPDKTIWDNIVSGCDLDGRIDPINPFCNVQDFPGLEEALVERMNQLRDSGSEPLLAGKTDAQIQEIVTKIMFGNVERFLSMYFTDAYLTDTTVFP